MTAQVQRTNNDNWLNGTTKSESLLDYKIPYQVNNNKENSLKKTPSMDFPPPPPSLSPSMSLRDTSSPLPPTPLPPKTKSKENLTQIHGTVPVRKKLTPLTNNSTSSPMSASMDDLLSNSPRRTLRSMGSPPPSIHQIKSLRKDEKSVSVDFELMAAEPRTPLTQTSARILRHSSERKPAPAKPPRESIRRSRIRQEQLARSREYIHGNQQLSTVPNYQPPHRVPLAVHTPTVPGNGVGVKHLRPVRPISLLQNTHDYEELPNTKYKSASAMNMQPDTIALLRQSNSDFASHPPDKPPHPRNYYPLPSALMTPSYPPTKNMQSVRSTSSKKRTGRCLWCLLFGVIASIIVAVTAISLVLLLLFGMVSPFKDFNENDQEISQLHLQQERQHQKIVLLEREITELQNVSKTNEKAIKSALKDDVIRTDNIENVMSFRRDQCSYQTYSIGSSSKQQETDSGEYYAEKGSAITGVGCSSSRGYLSTLHSRVDDLKDGTTRDVFWCTCERFINFSSVGRIECRIHYWQCKTVEIDNT